jgi:polysaccharide biosynthesis transport protein
MNEPDLTRRLARSERIYRWLLNLYPRAYRRDYGEAMVQLFRDQCRDAHGVGGRGEPFRFWLRTLWDLVKSVWSEQADRGKGEMTMSTIPGSNPTRRRWALATFLLITGLSVAVTCFQPRSYVSTARVVVHETQGEDTGAKAALTGSTHDPYFLGTEFERLKSKDVLYSVIRSLNLQQRWAQKYGSDRPLTLEEARAMLTHLLDVRQHRGTSLIEIRVFSDDPNEASEIANQISSIYRNLHAEKLWLAAAQGVNALKEEKSQQEKKVQEAQASLDKLRQRDHVSDWMVDDPQAGVEQLRQLDRQEREAEMALSEATALNDRLRGMHPDELRQVLPTAFPDALLTELLTRFNQSEVELLSLKSDRTDSHPEVRRVQAVLDKLNRQIDDRIQGILAGMSFKVKNLEQEYKLRALACEIQKKSLAENTVKVNAYVDAKRELEADQRLLQAISLRLQQEQVDAKLTKSATVEIIDRAEPGLRPVRPNWFANVFVGMLLGLLVIGIGSLLRLSTSLLGKSRPAAS